MKKRDGNSTWGFMKDFTEEQILGKKSPSRGEKVYSILSGGNVPWQRGGNSIEQ